MDALITNLLEFFTHSSITPIQMIGLIEMAIGLFGLYVAYSFRRNPIFRMKLAMVYTIPIAAGTLTYLDITDTHFLKHFMILAFMIFITVLYWREVRVLTTSEGYHKTALADYLDDVPDLIWVKDAECRYKYCNKALLRTFGVTRDEILGKTDVEIGICKKRKGQRFDFDVICDRSDTVVRMSQTAQKFMESGYIGEQFYSFQVFKSPIRTHAYNKPTKYTGYMGIARDLTDDVLDHKEVERMIDRGEVSEALSMVCLHKEHFKTIEMTDEELDKIFEFTKKAKKD